MKKLLSLLVLLSLVCSLVGCSQPANKQTENSSETPDEATESISLEVAERTLPKIQRKKFLKILF